MTPKLSVIIPAYNAEVTIRDCLLSVIRGCEDDAVEILVVNDGSSDGTLALCRAVPDARIRVCSQGNMGVSAARNKGMQLAQGDYIMFVDADDVLAPDWFSLVAPYLDGSEDVVVFTSEAGKIRYSVDELVESVVGVGPRLDSQVRKPPVEWARLPSSRVYLRRFLEAEEIAFDARIINGEDALFNLDAFLSTERVRFVDEHFYSYRVHPSSATHMFDDRFFSSNEAYLRKLESLLGSSGRYSQAAVKSLVDYSFCNSVEVMALRAAHVGDFPGRKRAARAVASAPIVQSRMGGEVDITRNAGRTRALYRLAKRGLLGLAVEVLHAALAVKGCNEGRERWVSI